MEANRQYKNPPIIEAVCEFRFTQETLWDLAIPGLVYEKVKHEFPIREEKSNPEIQVTQTDQGLKQDIRPSTRIFFKRNTEMEFLQLGTRILAINHLKSYPGWNHFKPTIDHAFQVLSEIAEIKGIEQISLRYINKLELPGKRIDLRTYFHFYPFLNPKLPQQLNEFIIGCQLPYLGDRDTCRMILTNTPPGKEGKVACLLDLDYSIKKPQFTQIVDIQQWVEVAHSQLEANFEDCITDELRGYFNKEVFDV